jgi:ABC-2 type transport system ATP-binding protein
MNGTAIEIEGVSKRFGAIQSLDRLSLCVATGGVVGLLGPNGAGKTTTMRTLLGLVRPDEGRISIFGLDPRTQAREIRMRVGVLFENDGLYTRLSAWNNLELHSRIWHLAEAVWHRRAEEILRSMDLWARRHDRTGTWSKGMRQKLALTRALLHEPKLLLLDEPFSGLDPVAAVDLRGRIVNLAAENGVTVLLATHDLSHVERACDRVAVIRKGRVIAEGTPGELGAEDRPSEVEMEVKGRGLDEFVLAAMRAEAIILSFTMNGLAARIRCTAEGRDLVGAELIRRGVVIEELHTVANTLEDSFLSLMSVAKRGEL